MADIFSSSSGSQQPMYIPPPAAPAPPPTFADAAKSPGYNPTASLIGGAGGTNVTGGLTTEASTTRKTLLGQ